MGEFPDAAIAPRGRLINVGRALQTESFKLGLMLKKLELKNRESDRTRCQPSAASLGSTVA
jgi:hypothetical protein